MKPFILISLLSILITSCEQEQVQVLINPNEEIIEIEDKIDTTEDESVEHIEIQDEIQIETPTGSNQPDSSLTYQGPSENPNLASSNDDQEITEDDKSEEEVAENDNASSEDDKSEEVAENDDDVSSEDDKSEEVAENDDDVSSEDDKSEEVAENDDDASSEDDKSEEVAEETDNDASSEDDKSEEVAENDDDVSSEDNQSEDEALVADFSRGMHFIIRTSATRSSFTLPLSEGFDYDFIIDWGDGERSRVQAANSPTKTHEYLVPGDYEIKICGKMPAWNFKNSPSAIMLLHVKQLGEHEWQDLSYAFYKAYRLQSFNSGITDTSQVSAMDHMFVNVFDITKLDLSTFDTSNVKLMTFMFVNAKKLKTLDLTGFNTTNVINMGYMFYGLDSITELDLSSFNTENLEYVYGMFKFMHGLTRLDLSHFKTKKLKNMSGLVWGMPKLELLNLNNWDTSHFIHHYNWMVDINAKILCNDADNGGQGLPGTGTIKDIPCEAQEEPKEDPFNFDQMTVAELKNLCSRVCGGKRWVSVRSFFQLSSYSGSSRRGLFCGDSSRVKEKSTPCHERDYYSGIHFGELAPDKTELHRGSWAARRGAAWCISYHEDDYAPLKALYQKELIVPGQIQCGELVDPNSLSSPKLKPKPQKPINRI